MPSATYPTPSSPPHPSTLLNPLLTSLPTAHLPHPPPHLLPHLSPILRQRVKLLSTPSTPWLPLLSYSPSGAKLLDISQSETFAPHPVSGEVELDIDWDDERDVQVRYRRADAETLQARVVMGGVGVWATCVFCAGDAEGEGGEGWRIGEVGVLGEEAGGEWWADLGEAERRFVEGGRGVVGESRQAHEHEEDEDDDAAYWAQYDSTPAVTPGPEQMRPSNGARNGGGHYGRAEEKSDEDAYYAQYSAVQPALDGHDPDEAGAVSGESSLGREHGREYLTNAFGNGHANSFGGADREMGQAEIAQPRPNSSSSAESRGSQRSVAVEKLEERAESMGSVDREAQNEVAIRQHIATSLKSLYRLARAGGMEREDFAGLVEREVALLGVEEDGA